MDTKISSDTIKIMIFKRVFIILLCFKLILEYINNMVAERKNNGPNNEKKDDFLLKYNDIKNKAYNAIVATK
jgi:hypothetical protein